MSSVIKIFSLFLIIAIVSIPNQISKGCGPIIYEFKGFSFFDADLVRTGSPFTDFFLRFDDFYHSYAIADSVRNQSNLEEWNNIFCGAFYEKEIQDIVYGNIENIKAIQRASEKKKNKLGLRLSRNSFAKHLVDYKCTETIDYLLFAKNCEPHVTHSINAWDGPKRDPVAMKALIYEGERVFLKLKSNNIKLRYAYQLIRLAHYAGDYEMALDLYDRLLPRIDPVESILHDWILAHKAGALLRSGQRVEAAYLFSLVFDRSPSKREAAFQSFSIRNEKEWKACMLLCQSNHERATLHAMRASEDHSKPVNDMRAIYALDPQNDNLELLLAKEIKELEKDFLGTEFNRHRKDNVEFHKIPRKQATANLIDLTQFVIKAGKEKKVRRPELWRLAEGYLLYLSNDLYAADQVFKDIEKILPTEKLQEQLAVFRLVLKITNYQNIDEAKEQEIVQIIKKNDLYEKYPEFEKFINDKLAYEYLQAGHAGKAYRMHHTLEAIKPNPQVNIINDLIEIALEPEKSRFDKILTTNKDGTEIIDDLLDIKGVMLWNKGEAAAALETFKQIPVAQRGANRFNPFIERAKICVHCIQPDSLLIYNRPGILEHIFELEFQANSDYSNSAKYFYQLGLAYFNLSYFGPSWNAMDFFRSGNNWRSAKSDTFEHWYFPFGNKENHDLSKAKSYFEKVLEVSKDRERSARATFWLARCDWLSYVTSSGYKRPPSSNHLPDLPPEYRIHYQQLASDYAETDFYEWVIRECDYFQVYAR